MWDFDELINRATILYGPNEPFEVIAKYSGDILQIEELDNVYVEILNNTFAIISLTLENAKEMLSYEQINYVEIPKKLSIVQQERDFLDEYYKEKYICPTNDTNLTGKGVLVSILDSGIAYQHKDFRNNDGSTRILYLWDQTVNGSPPENFYQGTLYTKAMIDLSLARQIPLPTYDSVGHGTMVAGICVGNGNLSDGKYKGVAPDAEMMVVKVGRSEYESFAMSTEFMRGIKFSYDMAKKEDLPLVINMSYGTNIGSHFGDSLFEEYIDDMITSYPSTIVVASGNEGNAGHHYSSVLMNDETENIKFDISGGLRNVEISLWKNFVDDFSVELVSPSGESTGKIFMSSTASIVKLSDCKISVLYAPPTPYRIIQEVYMHIAFDTVSQGTQDWTLNVYSEKVVDGRFEIWLPITEEVSRQTRFINATQATTLTIPSTANTVITVGGYDTTTNKIAEFSGRGFKANEINKPDLVAPGIDIITTTNLLSYDTTTGTSFSAPFVTGACAVLMQYGIVDQNEVFLFGEKLKAYLMKGAKRTPENVYPNRDFGYGTLCLENTLDILRVVNNTQMPLTLESADSGIINRNTEILIQKTPDLQQTLSSINYIDSSKIDFNAFSDFVIAELPTNKVEDLKKLNPQLNIEMAIPLSQMSSEDNYYTPTINNDLNAGEGVLIAIIDHDVDILDDCFRDEYGKSKIKYYLDLEDNGLELNTNNVNSIITKNSSRQSNSHGTMISRIASSESPKANFIVVNLKKASENVLEDNFIKKGLTFSSIDVIKSLHYVATRAIELSMPLSIGLCLGSNFGAHAGDTLFEKYISKLCLQRGVSICVASGNESDKKNHLERTLYNGRREFFSVNVCESEKDLPIFIYTYNIKSFLLSITTPNGESFNYKPKEVIETLNYKYKFEESFVKIETDILKQQLIITLNNAIKGIYTISYTPDIDGDSKLHAYLPTSTHLSENTYFTTPSPNFTCTIPSTAENVISVGVYTVEEINTSGRGPNRNMEIRPTISTNYQNYSSTSFATAKIMGVCANLLQLGILEQKDNNMNTKTIENILKNFVSKNEEFNYPNNIEGYGRIDCIKF